MAKITEGDYIYDTAFTMFEEAKKYCLEAKKYQKAGYYQKALEEYDSTLFWLESFFSLSERNNSVSLSLKTEIFFLFFVVNIVGRIRNCYIELKEPYKLSVFLKIFEEIVETIGKHEKNLSAEEFIVYQKLTKEIELDPDDIEFAEAKAILEKGYQDIIDNSDDPTFIGLVSKYEKCCSYEKFLVPSKGVIIEDSSSCFIATAAYSTSAHPDIDTFRNFRDKKLLTNPVGQALVSLYYKISPSIANYVKRQPVIKSFLRQQLERLAEWMRSQEVKS